MSLNCLTFKCDACFFFTRSDSSAEEWELSDEAEDNSQLLEVSPLFSSLSTSSFSSTSVSFG